MDSIECSTPPRAIRLLGSLLVLLVLVVIGFRSAHADPGRIQGDVPSDGGVAAVIWGGGSPTQIREAALARGCGLTSLWVFKVGAPVGYLFDAPQFVNSSFNATFSTGDVSAGTIVILQCVKASAPPAASIPEATPALTPTRTPTPTPTPPQEMEEMPSVRLVFDSAVSEPDRAAVRRGVVLAQSVMNAKLGGSPRTACIELRIDSARAGSGTTAGNRASLFTEVIGWPLGAQGLSWHLTKIVAHEYTHVWQFEVSRGRMLALPNWLVEGMAEYVAYEAIISGGMVSASDVRSFNLGQRLDALPPLASFERPPPFAPQVNYGYVTLAVSYLMVGHDVGDLRVLTQSVANGTPWDASFETVFGETPSSFYARFETYRAAGYR